MSNENQNLKTETPSSQGGVMAMLPAVTLLEKVTRVEVIDQNGRAYINKKPAYNVEIHLQDDGRTLKVFIGN